ncbi:MAG: hypothetical protein IPJ04_15745 [Candidatus Eisenbacteria bacterium]|nr:hypothetical protein [Candidatus Eisenbacteria bacterium]
MLPVRMPPTKCDGGAQLSRRWMIPLGALALIAAAPAQRLFEPKPFDLIVADREEFALPKGRHMYVDDDFIAVVVNVGSGAIKGDELMYSHFEVTSSDPGFKLFPFKELPDSLNDDLAPGDAIGSDSLLFTQQLHSGERLEPGRESRKPYLAYFVDRDKDASSDGPVNFHIVWDLAGSRAEWDLVATFDSKSRRHGAVHTRRIHSVPIRRRTHEW